MQILKRIDGGLARGEGAIAAAVLLSMIVLAAAQAVLYNLATRVGLSWANDALLELDWVDSFLQKGTLWLAFLGASLATYDDRHIAVDALSRVLPGRVRLIVKSIVTLAAAITCFFLAQVFYMAALRAQDRPLEYEILADGGPVHICAAPAQALADAQLDRPDLFCAMRYGLEQLGVRATDADGSLMEVETPFGMLQLIVPIMFLIMALRFAGRSIGTARAVATGAGEGLLGHDELAEARRARAAERAKSEGGDDPEARAGEDSPRETRKLPRASEGGPGAGADEAVGEEDPPPTDDDGEDGDAADSDDESEGDDPERPEGGG